jgi:hypothetical protein|tara:strand:+ start:362 stop:751 length:390 start_codon:yes stop_codon:yes gene_type:complete
MSEIKKLTIKERWRKAMTADNIVDFSVDMFLILFDVLSSPILIVMRLVRWVINKFFVQHIKSFFKRIVHWFIDNRKIRLEKKQNIFRYYWWLWLLSPVILFGLLLGIALLTGLIEGLNLGFDLAEEEMK